MKKTIIKSLLLAMLPLCAMGQTEKTENIQNPMLWADCPDPDVIRVGDTFYMVTTTMHLMPIAPCSLGASSAQNLPS